MKTTTLASLAYLKVNWDVNHLGYLDNFLPFLKEALKSITGVEIDVNQLQLQIKEQFGLLLPINVIKTLLIRAIKKGVVTKERNKFFKSKRISQESNFEDNQRKAELIYSHLVSEFVKYAKEKHQKNISLTDAESIFLSFLSYNQFEINGSIDVYIIPENSKLEQKEKFILSDFLFEKVKNDSILYEEFQSVLLGFMLANAIYLPEPNNISKNISNLSLYFDTSYIMYALGYDGKALEQPSKELLDMLYEQGASLFCFRHTVEEIRGILFNCSGSKNPNHNEKTTRFDAQFLLRRLSPSEILYEINNLEIKIENLRIKIIDIPDFKEHKYVPDELNIGSAIKKSIKYFNNTAFDRDVDSISAIYRIRHGNFSQKLENCIGIFVTTNNTLSYAINQHFFHDYGFDLIPPCISDFTLTTILWLKKPIEIPDLPFSRVMADCFAAIQPSKDFLERWNAEIEKYKDKENLPQDQYSFMKFAPEVYISVMELTLGDATLINDNIIRETYLRANLRIRNEISREFHDSLMNKESERKNLEEQYSNIQNDDIRITNNIRSYAVKQGRLVKNVFFVIISLLVFPSLLFSVLSLFPSIHIASPLIPVTWLLIISFTLSQILGYLGIISGISVRDVGRKIETNVIRRIEKKFLFM